MNEDERKKYMQLKQQVLPFDFWEEEKRLEAERLQDQNSNLPHFPEPKNDNEILLECQWQYKHGDQKALEQMYRHSKTLCLKFINAIGQKSRHVKTLSWEVKKIKAEDAATYLIEQFINRQDFVIVKNFPGYLFLRVVHELYYMRKVDRLVDFVDLQKFFKEGQDDNTDELISQSEDCSLLQEREIIHYTIKEECESEEDQEQRELKAFYMWKKNKGKRTEV